ncbi:hypothetical protein M408DRAFT_27362 [Serendipita vermifera MAFF 305830]|uniref:Uncharacterized protein n=1 Tax=Serendipita vermifera MAFF 305830 TaxID=933852 RepID=A0A0C3AXX7_SERVB|nr:hypothetical protein M408DRAFT_27362 [Serendipita vermifera MAFF 305830]
MLQKSKSALEQPKEMEISIHTLERDMDLIQLAKSVQAHLLTRRLSLSRIKATAVLASHIHELKHLFSTLASGRSLPIQDQVLEAAVSLAIFLKARSKEGQNQLKELRSFDLLAQKLNLDGDRPVTPSYGE